MPALACRDIKELERMAGCPPNGRARLAAPVIDAAECDPGIEGMCSRLQAGYSVPL
jgi:hypothetical protein